MADSNKRTLSCKRNNRPPKPYKDFPLTPHPAGYWCKTIRGKLHYFGRWGRVRNGTMERLSDDGWEAALTDYQSKRDDLHAGRTPRVATDGLSVGELCDRFLQAKERLLDTGELTPRSFADYKRTTDRIVDIFGGNRRVDDLASDDFDHLRADIAKSWGPVALGNEVGRIRSVFKFAYDAGLIDKPMRYGPHFKKPSKKTLRKARQANGRKDFDADEIRAILDVAAPQLRAMILLGINCGFGPTDCGTLPMSAVDLESGWIDFPRPKTAIERRCPLWPETVDALRAAMDERPQAKQAEDADRVFITKYGQPWVKADGGATAIIHEVRKAMKAADVYQRGRGFYGLRHTFQTVGEEAGETATRAIMGHVDDSMSANYRARIADDRLRAVTDHVRDWLFEKSRLEE